MTVQCPVTCGRCSTNSTSSYSSRWQLPLASLISCSFFYLLLSNMLALFALAFLIFSFALTEEISATCADRVNPTTGVSDCPARASLCNNSVYYDIMTTQCPRTCGRCTSSSTISATSSASTTVSCKFYF